MRNDSGRERLTATTLLAYQYRRWHDSTPDDAAAQMAQAEVRSAVLDDLLWIIRYATGEPQLQVSSTSAYRPCAIARDAGSSSTHNLDGCLLCCQQRPWLGMQQMCCVATATWLSLPHG